MSGGSTYAQARDWFEANWSPERTVREWWRRLAESGWGFPEWPTHWFGRGLDHAAAREVRRARRDVGALEAPFGVATMMVAPTLMALGDDEHLRRYLPAIVDGTEFWCQLFSEPGAGSDLAGLQTRAVRDGDEWVVNGQKVWTSGGHHARRAILLARTDADVPKHRGLSFFLVDMCQPGIEVRPLRQMNGLSEFNEVFLTDARVAHVDMVGGEGDGWRVALELLGHERSSVDADAESTGGVMGELDLDAPAGSYVVDTVAADVDPSGIPVGRRALDLLLEAARAAGAADDPVVRQRIAAIASRLEIARFSAGSLPPSLGKNATTAMMRLFRDSTLALQGAAGTATGADAPFGGLFQHLALTMPGLFIAGGTEEIQRNIIGERLLGLPAEPRVDKDVPFREVRQAVARPPR